MIASQSRENHRQKLFFFFYFILNFLSSFFLLFFNFAQFFDILAWLFLIIPLNLSKILGNITYDRVSSVVYQFVYVWHGVRIFRTRSIETHVIFAHFPLPLSLFNYNNIIEAFYVSCFIDEISINNPWIVMCVMSAFSRDLCVLLLHRRSTCGKPHSS